MLKKLRIPIPDAERRNCVVFVLTFAWVVVAWAVAHDEYLIRVAPAHFTEYHRPLLPIKNHTLLALQYATVATFGPGMLFGALCFLICRLGRRPKLGLCIPLRLFAPMLLCVEFTSLTVAQLSRARVQNGQSPIYPTEWYPEGSDGIIYTQSANITAVLTAFGFSAVFFAVLIVLRYKTSAKNAPITIESQ